MGVQSIELGARRIVVDDTASALVKENRHPFTERFNNSYKPYTVSGKLTTAIHCVRQLSVRHTDYSQEHWRVNTKYPSPFTWAIAPGFYLVSSPIVSPLQPIQLTADKLISRLLSWYL